MTNTQLLIVPGTIAVPGGIIIAKIQASMVLIVILQSLVQNHLMTVLFGTSGKVGIIPSSSQR